MTVEFLIALVSVGIGLAGAFWTLVSRVSSVERTLDHLEEKIMGRFDDHKEDHKEHHKEIADLFGKVQGELTIHTTETRLHHQELIHKLEKDK